MVTRPHFTNGDQSVILTATLFKGMVTNTKIFTLTVIALPITDAYALAIASNALEITYTGGETSNAVSNDASLATNAPNGVSITWMSSATNVIATNGMVTRPHFTNGDQSVTLNRFSFQRHGHLIPKSLPSPSSLCPVWDQATPMPFPMQAMPWRSPIQEGRLQMLFPMMCS